MPFLFCWFFDEKLNMKINFWCSSDIIKKQGCVEMVLIVNGQIMGRLPLGTYSFLTFQREVSAHMKESGTRCFHIEALVHFL